MHVTNLCLWFTLYAGSYGPGRKIIIRKQTQTIVGNMVGEL